MFLSLIYDDKSFHHLLWRAPGEAEKHYDEKMKKTHLQQQANQEELTVFRPGRPQWNLIGRHGEGSVDHLITGVSVLGVGPFSPIPGHSLSCPVQLNI